MQKLIERLAKALYYPETPSPLFVESLGKYAKIANNPIPSLDSILSHKPARVLALSRKLSANSTAAKAVYALACIADTAPGLEEELRLALRRAALGFPVPQLTNLAAIRNALPLQIYQIVQRVCKAAFCYKKICIESSAPRSQTHSFFLEACAPVLRQYEEAVIKADADFLAFHAQMYSFFCKLREMCHINDLIAEGVFLKSKTTPENTQPSPSTMFHLAGAAHHTIFNHLLSYADIAYRVHNVCARAYMLTGTFQDPYSEFFIKDHVLDYGKVPPIIDNKLAEQIAYIGRNICFLRYYGHPQEITELIEEWDISKKSASTKATEMLCYTNSLLWEKFIQKYKIRDLLVYIRSVFLGGRGDFVEYLFSALKESRHSSKKDVTAILEAALQDAFPNSPFNRSVDIFIKGSADGQGAGANSGQLGSDLKESFSLFCKLEYPVTMLLEEEFVLRLVYIFKFLWKLKRVEHLARRVAPPKYVNFVNRLMFYVFNEAMVPFDVNAILDGWRPDRLALDCLKMELGKSLDITMNRLFLNTTEKRIEYLLFYMERSFVAAGRSGVFDDSEIQAALVGFYEYAHEALSGTYLCKIDEFIAKDMGTKDA